MAKSNLTFTEDIIKEVAKELGLKEEEVSQVYSLNVKYIRHLMNQEDTCAIQLPYLGTPHINKGLLLKSVNSQKGYKEKDYNIDEEKYEKNTHKLEMIKDLERRRKEAKAGTSNHSKRTILKKLKFMTGKNLEEIEDIQKEKNGN